MFGWQPRICIADIKDDLTNLEAGYSFVTDPQNQLQNSYRELLRRGCLHAQNALFRQESWDWKEVFLYLKKEEALRMELLGSLDIDGGQKPRSPELLGLLCENTALSQRSIFIKRGAMFYSTSHHKAKKSTNREFVVARFLSARLTRVLYQYLVCIRPFTNLLHREHKRLDKTRESGRILLSPLLFRITAEQCSRAWPRERLTQKIKRVSTKAWGYPVTSQ